MTKWEYLPVQFRREELNQFKESLNKFGELGWDLISMVPIESKSVGLFDSGSATSDLIAVFKRPKEQIND